jgi:beta-glucanase (GH16 family)
MNIVESMPKVPRRRRRLLAATVAITVAAGASASFVMSAHAAVSPVSAGMTLVFSDDFSGAAGTGLNTANWLYNIGTSYPGGAANWGTHEIETATNSTANVYQDGKGHLAIKPIRDGAGNWTSGRVETHRTDFAAPAGGKVRIEGSLQQPNVSGAAASGYWPAFWAMGAAARPAGAMNWPGIGEWDIMETVNGRRSVFSTLHCGVAPGGACNEFSGLGSGEHACPECQTGFHTYAVEYDRSVSPEELRWYLDGVQYHSLTADQMDTTTWNNATHHGMFIILNVAMGGDFPAAFDGAVTEATQSGVPMLVDHVAVYQSGGGTTNAPTDPPASPPTNPPTDPPATPPTNPPDGARSAYSTIEAESFHAQAGVITEPSTDGGQNIGAVGDGDWVQYNDVDFGTGGVRDFVARVSSGAAPAVSGLVEVRVGSPSDPPIGSFALANTGGWQSWRSIPGNASNVTGSQTVFLTFTSGQPDAFVNVDWFTFRR